MGEDAHATMNLQHRNAEYLQERLLAPEQADDGESSPSDLEAWKRALTSKGRSFFPERLALLQIDQAEAEQLTRRFPKSPQQTPVWASLLETAFSAHSDASDLVPDQPFSECWAPLVAFAGAVVFSEKNSPLSANACTDLLRHLQVELGSVAAAATYRCFEGFRSQGGTFASFVKRARQNHCHEIFETYPVLARILSRYLSTWISSTRLLLRRLQNDEGLLRDRFNLSARLFRVESITPGLSDRHAGGFQVLHLHFPEGASIVYKPKEMSLEGVVPRINDWLAKENGPTRLRFPITVDRGGYGWAEWVENRACESADEVRRFYFQAGALLCLAHLLNAKDLLFENVVAVGPDPVLIDLEAFFQPEVRTFDRLGRSLREEEPAYAWRGSVIETGLLPFWKLSASHPPCDLSALGCNSADLPPLKAIEWQDVNRTQMQPVTRPSRPDRSKHEVWLNGQRQKPEWFRQEISQGFSSLHAFILEHRESFSAFIGTWQHAKSRLVFRPTQLYSQLLKQSAAPGSLQSGIFRSAVFESLFRPALKDGYLSPELSAFLNSEVRALLDCDVPRYYVDLSSDSVRLDDGSIISQFLWESPLATVQRRLSAMAADESQFHLEVIESALLEKPARCPEILTRDFLVSQINSISERLLRSTGESQQSRRAPSRNERPDLSDVVRGRGPKSETRDQKPISYLWPEPACYTTQVPAIERLSVYSGDLGILLFLGAADHVLGTDRAADALRRFSETVSVLDVDDTVPLGIGNGVGSLIYGCQLLSSFSRDLPWAETVAWLESLVPLSRIEREQEPDLLYGLAGFLLALSRIELREQGGRSRTRISRKERLGKARACLQRLKAMFDREKGWVRPNGDSALGFAHGTAGIAFACAEAARAFELDDGWHLAETAVTFEESFFSADAKNWPPTTASANLQMRAWCSGLPGHLLARLALCRGMGKEAQVAALLDALPTLPGLDHWCCGAFGVGEIITYAAGILEDPALQQRASSLIQAATRRALESAFFRFSPHLGENFCLHPGLFRGLAGIGYSLLRVMEPDRLPCIIAFESEF
jgi:type 2 lantibiotic biosynthesis protein LanM